MVEKYHRPSTLWSYISDQKDNPVLLAVSELSARGYRIYTAKGKDPYGREGLEVHCNSQMDKDVLNRVAFSREVSALDQAFGTPFVTEEPKMDECSWDTLTKALIRVLFWKTKAEKYKRWEEETAQGIYKQPIGTTEKYRRWKEEAQKKAEELLPENSNFPTLEEIRGLISEVVDRVIINIAQKPSGNRK